MKKILLSFFVFMMLMGNVSAADLTGRSYGKTFQNNLPTSFNGVIEITNINQNKIYCFVGDTIPCVLTDKSLVQINGHRQIISYNKDINSENSKFEKSNGLCVEYNDGTLQCSAKTKNDDFSVEFKFN